MFFFKIKPDKCLSPSQFNSLPLGDKLDELFTYNTFVNCEKAIASHDYETAKKNLQNIAQDNSYKNRIRGKAFYFLYLLILNDKVPVDIPQGKTMTTICKDFLAHAADLGYEDAVSTYRKLR